MPRVDLTRIARTGRAFVLLLCLAGISSAYGQQEGRIFERSRALETEAFGLLLEHFGFEEGLLAPDNDRVVVFVSVPHGSRMVIEQVTLMFDGKPVVTHRYTISELERFLSEATQRIYMTRVPQGPHTVRLDVKVMQGVVRPMQTFTFNKGKAAKYIDLRIAGELAREVVTYEW